MLSSSLDTLLKVNKTTSPQKLFAYDCVTLYIKSLCKLNESIPGSRGAVGEDEDAAVEAADEAAALGEEAVAAAAVGDWLLPADVGSLNIIFIKKQKKRKAFWLPP